MTKLPDFEVAGGMAEKIVPIIRFPILMRVLMPGAIATAIVLPIVGFPPGLMSTKFDELWRPWALVIGLSVLLGVLVSALSNTIYKVYEGRILWPKGLCDLCTARQQAKVKKLLAKVEEAKTSGDRPRRAELWYQLRRYPLDDAGQPHAFHPTLLGNILAEYEDYPRTRYGMDAVFYWHRLWLAMDKEKKEEVDASWSLADGLLSASAVGFCGGVLWLTATVLFHTPWFHPRPPFDYWMPSLGVGVLLLFLGYGVYRLSLPHHRENGGTFKAIFDLYRGLVIRMTNIGPDESAMWHQTWAYLQYLLVRCMRCGKHYSFSEERCPSCSCPTVLSIGELRRRAVESASPKP